MQATVQDRAFGHWAEVARTLGHAHRLSLLDHIAQGERSVERLAEVSGLSVANASQHLQHLRRAGFIQARRDGKRVLYRLGDGPVMDLLTALRTYSEHVRSEIGELISAGRDGERASDPISRTELVRRIKEESITLLDVRPEEEFGQGHIPGALNIPLVDLEARLGELSPDQQIVAYCRGPYCVLSVEAVRALRARGFQARGLEDGFPQWKAAGLQIQHSDLGRAAR